MTRYADPERCPDCRGPIEYGAHSCPTCALPLEGPVARKLFGTLTQADELIRVLRDSRRTAVPATPVSTSGLPHFPAPAASPRRAARRLSSASVPRILLGLGAACLLVAALVFLAVTWSVMGVAGRTATLVGFTVLTGTLAGWLARRNLRAAAEALALVALGLLAFDLFGARDSGWFGDIVLSDFLVLLGVMLLAAGAAAALAVRRTPAGALAGAEVVAALGLATTCIGLVDGGRLSGSAALTVSVLLGALAAVVGARLRLGVLAVGTATVSGCAWLLLVATSLERAFAHPTAGELWLHLEAWPLVVAAALAVAVALLRSLPTGVRVAGTAVAEVLLAVAALVPFTQDNGTELTLAVLVVLVITGVLTWFAPTPWASGCAVSTGLSGLWMLGATGLLAMQAFARVEDAGAHLWEGRTAGHLPPVYDGPLDPWLLPIAVIAVVVTILLLAPVVHEVDQAVAPLIDPVFGAALLGAAATGTLAMYPLPVWLVGALMLLAAAGHIGWALRRRHGLSLALGTVFLSGALTVGLYDEWLTAVVLLVALTLSGLVHLRWEQAQVRMVAGFLAVSSLAASIWTLGAIADVEQAWTALTVLVVLGLLVQAAPKLCRLNPERVTAQPRESDGSTVGVEVGTAVAMLVLGTAGLAAAPTSEMTSWAAVYLTVAGAAASAMALLRPDRRELGWAGGLLLAMATWVRLWDIGIHDPEPYTLPSAVALTMVGLLHLRRNREADTMTALAPGLALALVPSLLWVFWDPATLRSLLLGVACLALLVAGVRLRWTAPVVFAATVGAFVVLRHAAPFVDQAVPRWVLIGVAGSLLIGMGVTWERRLVEARAMLGYVRALR